MVTKRNYSCNVTMKTEEFPFEIVPAEEEIKNELRKHFKGKYAHNVRVGPRGYFLPEPYQHQAASIYHMPLRPDDTFVASYLRSGTTWTQELVWLIKNDLDFETAKKIPLDTRYIYLDLLPPNLLDTSKVVYVARDPRDVVIPYYDFTNNMDFWGFVGDFDTFFDLFLRDLTIFSPILEHVKEAWKLREHPNMCFIFYEDLYKDLVGTCGRVAEFFGKQYSREQLEKLAEHLHFDNFRNNKAIDPQGYKSIGVYKNDFNFVRKGKSGGWRTQLSEAQKQRATQWMQEKLKGTDLKYPEV